MLRLRLKDKHAPALLKKAAAVNTVFNFVNETGLTMLQRVQRFVSVGELHLLTVGAGKAGLDLQSQTIQAVNEEFVTRRQQFQKARLRWRVSNPERSNYSLGWVPFKAAALRYRNGQLFMSGFDKPLSLWDSYGLADYELGPGSFSEDARGRWYVNITVKVTKKPKPELIEHASALGIDLGLKSLMTDSDGGEVPAQRFYRDLEPKIASAQRAGQKGRVRALHAKVGNRRKDHLHKLSTAQARSRPAIFVGDVSSSGLAKTRMAKSVLDAGWSSYRTMLRYKCDDPGAWFKEVDEAYSTQDCHVCGNRSGPKGLAGLSVRQWTCAGCKTVHNRDENSACEIKRRGLVWLEKEFTAADSARVSGAVAVNKDLGP